MAFVPAAIDAEVGDRISWINAGGLRHELYFPEDPTNSGRRHLQRVLTGDRPVSIIVSRPGDYDYFCRWHGMHGSVHVLANPE